MIYKLLHFGSENILGPIRMAPKIRGKEERGGGGVGEKVK